MQNFRKSKNLIKDYIFHNQMQKASEITIKSLLRAISEPLIQTKSEGVVLIRLFDKRNLESLLKRLEYSNSNIYFYCDMNDNPNIMKEDIWEKTEFAVILAPRYSAALIWDYSSADVNGYTDMNFYLNSNKIQNILKIIIDNSKIDFLPDISDYSLERRENPLMTMALCKVIDTLNDTEREKEINSFVPLIKSEELNNSYDLTNVKNLLHEIKNNIAVIDLHSKIIEKRLEKEHNPKNSENLQKIFNAKQIISQSSDTIKNLLNELKQPYVFKLSEKNIEDIVNLAVNKMMPSFEAKSIKIENNLKKINVMVDEEKVLGVLLNVIGNAIYALSENGKLKINSQENEIGYISLLIENDGMKIPEEMKSEIFKEGFSNKENGNGLGLKISKDNMQKMSGDLKLIQSNDKATIFEIIMPKA